MCDDKTWELIKAEYIAGGTSYSLLAKKYGIPKGTIGAKAASQGWSKLHKRIANETQTILVNKIAEQNAERFVKLYAIQERYEELLENACRQDLHRDTGLRDLGTAIATAIANKRDLYGLLTEAQKQQRERTKIAWEQLELQKKQQAIASGEDTPQERWVIDYGEEKTDE